MSLLDKLNLKPTAKKVAVGASLTIERELNAFMNKAWKNQMFLYNKQTTRWNYGQLKVM